MLVNASARYQLSQVGDCYIRSVI